ncbi:MAG: tandem-95 repeat protein, partial [Pirellulales bacterium]|nr:tandem-95 repeat protein [Pirellulales bacterium]
MRSISSFLGQGKNRTSRRRSRANWLARTTRLAAQFEPLEERRLLAANVLNSLGQVTSAISTAGGQNELRLDVEGGPAILGLQMHSADGVLNPGLIEIRNLADVLIAPLSSQMNLAGSTDSLVLAELGPGSYTIFTHAEGGTAGTYDFDVFVAGDVDGDGRVSQQDLLWASAAMVQHEGNWNHMTALYYGLNGIDLAGPDLYKTQCDTDLDGDIDHVDLGRIDANSRAAQVTITLIADMESPELTAGLVNDTGRSATDGITNELAIAGTLTDENPIGYFRAGLDNMPVGSYVDILAEVDASGNFLLKQSLLEQIAGGPLANTGSHTLHLIAQDTIGNSPEAHIEVVFSLDTIAPDAPTDLKLTTDTDLGFFDDDGVTSDKTPTIGATAESSALVTFYSEQVTSALGTDEAIPPVGGSWTSGLALVTPATPLADGDHQITAMAEDLAGNVSVLSSPFALTIETTAPVAPTVDLAAASDTGTIGDKETSLTTVTLVGVTEPGARVSVAGTALSTTADGAGAYSLPGVALHWDANALTIVAMDLAGNTASTTETFKQNTAPTLGTAVGPVAALEDVPMTVDLSGLFADADLAQGDVLTLTKLDVDNPDLVTVNLTGDTGQIVGSQMELTFGHNLSGQATVTIQAEDSYHETIQTTVVINVAPVNDPPQIVTELIPVAAEEDTPVQIDLRQYVTDVETPVDQLEFELVDGSAVSGTAVMQGDNHTVVFTPDAQFFGIAKFDFKVKDTGDGPSPAITKQMILQIEVTEVNDPPVANDGTIDTVEDTPGTIDLRTLVEDPETTNKDNLTFTVDSTENGTYVFLDAYTVKFTPYDHFNDGAGTASFTYTVTDTGLVGGGGVIKSSSATVTVNVAPVNDAPTLLKTLEDETNEDTPISIDLLDFYGDIETAPENLVFTPSNPQNGTYTFTDGHTVEFAPHDNFNGTASFDFTVTDDGDPATSGNDAITLGPLTFTINVLPVNDPPTTTIPDQTIDEDTSLVINLMDDATDVETPNDLSFNIVGQENGTATLDGTVLTFEPYPHFHGTATFTFTITDNGDNGAQPVTSDPVTVTVTVDPVNDAPALIKELEDETPEDTPISIDLLDFYGDLETDPANLVFVVSNPQNGTYTFTDGHTVEFTPGTNFNGTASFDFTVTDDGDPAASGNDAITLGPLTFTINILPVNDPPVVEGASAAIDEDTYYDLDLRTLVQAGDETAPDDMTFAWDDVTGGTVDWVDDDHYIVRFTPESNYSGPAGFTFTATDDGDNGAAPVTSAPATISITVNPVNDAPALETLEDDTPEDTLISIDLLDYVSDIETDPVNLVFTPSNPQNGTYTFTDGHTVEFTPHD